MDIGDKWCMSIYELHYYVFIFISQKQIMPFSLQVTNLDAQSPPNNPPKVTTKVHIYGSQLVRATSLNNPLQI